MCAIRRISNRLSREWKLKRAVMDISGNKLKYALILSHKGKNNTSFGTVKGLLLFVCTPNMDKTLCFCKIKKTNRMRFLPSLSWAGTLNKSETKFSEYFPQRHDEYTASIESFKWLQNQIIQNQNKNCDTDSDNTSLLINNLNISSLPLPPPPPPQCYTFL